MRTDPGGTPAPSPSRFCSHRFPVPGAGVSEPPRRAAAPGGEREAAAGAAGPRVAGAPTAGPGGRCGAAVTRGLFASQKQENLAEGAPGPGASAARPHAGEGRPRGSGVGGAGGAGGAGCSGQHPGPDNEQPPPREPGDEGQQATKALERGWAGHDGGSGDGTRGHGHIAHVCSVCTCVLHNCTLHRCAACFQTRCMCVWRTPMLHRYVLHTLVRCTHMQLHHACMLLTHWTRCLHIPQTYLCSTHTPYKYITHIHLTALLYATYTHWQYMYATHKMPPYL